jgi:hypothetical protein
MGEFAQKVQVQFKKTSGDLVTFFVKLISGVMLSLTIALVIQEIMGKKDGEDMLSFLFVIVVFSAVFLRIAKNWSMTAVLIFDLICILIGMVLRLYIMVAPGA